MPRTGKSQPTRLQSATEPCGQQAVEMRCPGELSVLRPRMAGDGRAEPSPPGPVGNTELGDHSSSLSRPLFPQLVKRRCSGSGGAAARGLQPPPRSQALAGSEPWACGPLLRLVLPSRDQDLPRTSPAPMKDRGCYQHPSPSTQGPLGAGQAGEGAVHCGALWGGGKGLTGRMGAVGIQEAGLAVSGSGDMLTRDQDKSYLARDSVR